jgi:hypothetical protein
MRSMLSLVLASALMLTPAIAQPSKIEADITVILQKINADAKASLADADAHQDRIASTCWSAVADASAAKLAAQQAAGGGVMLAFQKLRDITRLNASPVGTDLILGCAPLAQDSAVSLLTFFTKIGAAVLVKGVLVP